MFESTLRILALVTSAFVLVSFGMFAIDQTRDASDSSAAQVAGQNIDVTTAQPAAQDKRSGVRKKIDSVASDLTSPFSSLTDGSTSDWVRRGAPTLLALLLYGFGLSYLARFARGRA